MKKEIIKTPEYLLVLDESEIQEGDYRMNIQRGYVKLVDDAPEYYNRRNDVFKKVIAHLPLNNSPILEGVPLLPPLEQEDDEKILFANEIENMLEYDRGRWYGRIEGYSKAREKYKFTEEDAKYLFECGRNFQINADITFTVVREHLSQPKMPTYFEFEIERKSVLNLGIEPFNPNTHFYTNEPKTTTNSQGQVVACGKYIYEL